eukprot:327310-Pleurochrysis_carterae.AAC.12
MILKKLTVAKGLTVFKLLGEGHDCENLSWTARAQDMQTGASMRMPAGHRTHGAAQTPARGLFSPTHAESRTRMRML